MLKLVAALASAANHAAGHQSHQGPCVHAAGPGAGLGFRVWSWKRRPQAPGGTDSPHGALARNISWAPSLWTRSFMRSNTALKPLVPFPTGRRVASIATTQLVSPFAASSMHFFLKPLTCSLTHSSLLARFLSCAARAESARNMEQSLEPRGAAAKLLARREPLTLGPCKLSP